MTTPAPSVQSPRRITNIVFMGQGARLHCSDHDAQTPSLPPERVSRIPTCHHTAPLPLHGPPGEPLLNYKNVRHAVRCMTEPTMNLCYVAPKQVTVSTSGIAPLMPKVGSELGVNLALSLHAPNAAIRQTIMPAVRVVGVADRCLPG
jgi:adenine C2-methylase RlmN of 23S rRNA A2503 and tRNA A37